VISITAEKKIWELPFEAGKALRIENRIIDKTGKTKKRSKLKPP